LSDRYATWVTNPQGPVNAGSGDMHVAMLQLLTDVRGRTPRKQMADDLRALENRFVHPPGFGKARDILRDERKHAVYLLGVAGAGRTAAAKILLKELGSTPDTTIHELLLQDKDKDRADPPLNANHIGDADLAWVDLTDTGAWSWPDIRTALTHVRYEVIRRSAYLVAILPRIAQAHEEEIQPFAASIERPPVSEVLLRALLHADIRPDESLDGDKFIAADRPLREVPEYVGLIAAARKRSAPGGTFAEWCAIAYQGLSGREDEVDQLVGKLHEGPQRALLLTVAMLSAAHADVIEEGAASLLKLTSQGPDDRPVLERFPLQQRLADINAERDPEGNVRFKTVGYDAAVRAYFWAHMAAAREPLRDWIADMAASRSLTVPDSDRLVSAFAELCLNDRYQHELIELVDKKWTGKEANGRQLRAAAVALQCGLRADRTGRSFRRQIYDWSRDTRITDRHAEVLVAACHDEMAVSHPDAALIRLLHLARRKPGSGATEALADLVRSDRYLFRLALDRLAKPNQETSRSANPRIFLSLADPRLVIDPGKLGRELISERSVREQLTAAWELAFTTLDSDSWVARAREWLRCTAESERTREALAAVLAGAAAGCTAVCARLYAMTRAPGFDTLTSRLLLDKITAAQAAKATDSGELESNGGVS
jgi:hypothetical protein